MKPLVLLALAIGLGAYALGRPAPPRAAELGVSSARHAPGKPGLRPPTARARNAPRPARERPRGQVIVRASWGSEVGALGRSLPTEGAPEGPASFEIDARGRVHVLDPVNGRIAVFEAGAEPRVVALPGDGYRDLALDSRGGAVAMDAIGRGTLTFLDATGRVAHTIPLAGPGIPEAGGATALFARDDGIWVEVEHATLVRVADANGTPDAARPALAGRFSRDGKSLLRATLAGPTAALVSATSVSGGRGFEVRIEFPLPLLGLHELASDDAGRVYLAAAVLRENPRTFEVVEEHETVVVLGEGGAELGRVELAVHDGPDDPLRFVRIGADGAIYELVSGDEGVTIERFSR